MAKEPKSQDLKTVEGTNECNRVTCGPWAGRLRANPTPSEFALAEGKKTPADFFMFQKPKKNRVSAGANPQAKENSSASGVVSRASRKQQQKRKQDRRQQRKERKQRVSRIRESHHFILSTSANDDGAQNRMLMEAMERLTLGDGGNSKDGDSHSKGESQDAMDVDI
ncbi:hypothetical protein PG996_012276 [Apiospora saccharicola]|uniref:BZIP domain-containing protein n=1 Tax=Apiospora saccharicola TaxID=335842 RepID=A0ABR1U249_9PEZI